MGCGHYAFRSSTAARVYADMFSLAQAHQAFDGEGRIANDLLQTRFEDTIGCFLDLVEAA